MCGRYASFREDQVLADQFAIARIADDVRLLPPSWNVAPTDPVRIVVERPERLEDGSLGGLERTLRTARWGLVPSWAKDPRIGSTMINARAETLATKPAFRRAFATRRALLPADGYYEWQAPEPGAPSKVKRPFYIHAADGAPLAMAGLYEFWKVPDGSWLTTATVITTSATDEVGHLHDRMPMSVPAENWSAWLDPGFGSDARVLLTVGVSGLAFHPVSTAVNKVANDGPELVEPVAL